MMKQSSSNAVSSSSSAVDLSNPPSSSSSEKPLCSSSISPAEDQQVGSSRDGSGGAQEIVAIDRRGEYTALCRWTVENFTRVKAKALWSKYFDVGGYDCRLLVYPRGDSQALPGYVSIYLQIMDPRGTSSSRWDCFASYRLSIVNHVDESLTIHKDSWHRFSSKKKSHGWCDFTLSSSVLDPKMGFLFNNDSLLITADILILNESVSFSRDTNNNDSGSLIKEAGPVPDVLSGKFTWKVNNFCLFKEMIKTQKIMSPVFPAGDCNLRISVYQSVVNSQEYISMCLESKETDKTMVSDRSCWCLFRMSALNQKPGCTHMHRDSYGRFAADNKNGDNTSLGWNDYMKMSDFVNPESGFLLASVDDYFGRLTKIWDGIRECMNSKRCTCGKCKCDLNTAHEAEREVLCVHDFLAGLDESTHGVIRSQICAITALPDLDSVYQTVVRNETIRSSVVQETPVMSFAAQFANSAHNQQGNSGPRPGFVPNRDPSRKCSACGRTGHEASSCWKVVRYPEWYGKGHGASGRGAPPIANSTQIIGANSAALPSTVALSDSDRQGLSGIFDEQWKIIQRMVGSTPQTEVLSGKTNFHDWILDTGATHHMTGKADARAAEHERKKGVPWTEEEHRQFLMGLKKYGKGDWRNIARNFVTTRTPTQVASHAQKYFIRQVNGGKDKRRSSIHDITTVNIPDTLNAAAADTANAPCSPPSLGGSQQDASDQWEGQTIYDETAAAFYNQNAFQETLLGMSSTPYMAKLQEQSFLNASQFESYNAYLQM